MTRRTHSEPRGRSASATAEVLRLAYERPVNMRAYRDVARRRAARAAQRERSQGRVAPDARRSDGGTGRLNLGAAKRAAILAAYRDPNQRVPEIEKRLLVSRKMIVRTVKEAGEPLRSAGRRKASA